MRDTLLPRYKHKYWNAITCKAELRAHGIHIMVHKKPEYVHKSCMQRQNSEKGTSSGQANVWVCIYEQPHVEQVSDLGEVENEDPFKQDDIRALDDQAFVRWPEITDPSMYAHTSAWWYSRCEVSQTEMWEGKQFKKWQMKQMKSKRMKRNYEMRYNCDLSETKTMM